MKMTPKRRERVATAVRLRKKGLGYQEIADLLGVSKSQAYKDVDDGLKEITREPSEELLTLELERLDLMLTEISTQADRVTKALKDKTIDLERGVNALTKLTEQRLKISDRRSKFLGMDRVKVEQSINVEDSLRESLGTIVAVSESELIEQIGEDV